VCVLIVPVVVGYSRCKAKPEPLAIGAALAKLRLPGRAFVALAVLLQPTVTAAAGLLLLGPLLLFEYEEEPLENDIATSSSSNRLDRMYAVINDANNYPLHNEPHLRSASSVRAAGEDMYVEALRYASQQRPRSDAPLQHHHCCFIPPHVQQEHLMKLTILAAQPTARR
jgi:hypothetical protein